MSKGQAVLIVQHLATAVGLLQHISKQIERLIRVTAHQREQIDEALRRPGDDTLRQELGEYLGNENRLRREAARRNPTPGGIGRAPNGRARFIHRHPDKRAVPLF